MHFSGSLACALLTLVASGCAAHRATVAATARPAVLVTDAARESLPNDYLRVSFLPAGVEPTTLSRPGALRAFLTATPLYVPPLKVADYPSYSGLVNSDTNVLVAMRCQPQHPEKVDALLATWPNVFRAIQRDVPLDPSACSAHPSDAGTQIACYAKAFSDPPMAAVPTALAHTFSYAGELYETANATLAKWLQDNYGIYPAFAGSGYSVKDSYSLSTEPMTSQQILVKSISPEYILKNVSLADAGCRCISVSPYPGRSGDSLDPDFIEKAGGNGVCKSIGKLPAASH
jgi:hypothetical protein